MQTQIFYPPLHLRKYIRFFWTMDYNEPVHCQTMLKVFACRFPRLVIQHYNGRSAITRGNDLLPTVFLSGLHTQPCTLSFGHSISLTGVSFYPAAIMDLLGLEAVDLTDKFPAFNTNASRYLSEELTDLVSHQQRIALITHYFSARLGRVRPQTFLTPGAVNRIGKKDDDSTIHELVKTFKISERQLERRFRAVVGFGPKQFLRITRFEKGVDLIHQDQHSNLSDIAFELNYADQSHFIREFKEFSGYTPKQFANQPKLTTDTSSMLIRVAI